MLTEFHIKTDDESWYSTFGHSYDVKVIENRMRFKHKHAKKGHFGGCVRYVRKVNDLQSETRFQINRPPPVI